MSNLDSAAAIEAKLESGELSPTRAGSLERDLHVEALAVAACRLRDAELAFNAAQEQASKVFQQGAQAVELDAARKYYGETLQAFNRCVAPVSK